MSNGLGFRLYSCNCRHSDTKTIGFIRQGIKAIMKKIYDENILVPLADEKIAMGWKWNYDFKSQ